MTAKVLENLKYTKEHEWVLLEGKIATVGITDYAQSTLGDIVFLELPSLGAQIDKDKPCAVVESIKSVSDIYGPVSGKVVEVNQDLEMTPDKCNKDPYASWIFKIELSDLDDLQGLMSAKEYSSFCEK